MHGERFDIKSSEVQKDNVLSGSILSEQGFMYEKRWNSDLALAMAALMNAFPYRTNALNQPQMVKVDILSRSGFGAYVKPLRDCFWILFNEGMFQHAVRVSHEAVAFADEHGFFGDVSPERALQLARLTYYQVMEIILSHELNHIMLGHAGYANHALGSGLADSGSFSRSELASQFSTEVIEIRNSSGPLINQKVMEIVADEVAVRACLIQSLNHTWRLAPYETKDHFSRREILWSLSLALVVFATVCATEIKATTAYPSLTARLIRLGDVYTLALERPGQLMPGQPELDWEMARLAFERFRDAVKIVRDGLSSSRITVAPAVYTAFQQVMSADDIGAARNELKASLENAQAEIAKWRPYQCQVVPW